jgi:hypothetical protein
MRWTARADSPIVLSRPAVAPSVMPCSSKTRPAEAPQGETPQGETPRRAGISDEFQTSM